MRHLTAELSCGPAPPVRTNNKHCTGLTESAAPRRPVPPAADSEWLGGRRGRLDNGAAFWTMIALAMREVVATCDADRDAERDELRAE